MLSLTINGNNYNDCYLYSDCCLYNDCYLYNDAVPSICVTISTCLVNVVLATTITTKLN